MHNIVFRRLAVLLFIVGQIACCSAQSLVRNLFESMPDSIVPYLSANNRLDLLDYFDSGMTASVSNALGGKSTLTQLTGNFLSVNLTASSSMQMMLLDVKQPVDSCQQVLCVVRTYGVDVRESTIDFYSLQWRRLAQSDYLQLPQDDNPLVATLSSDDVPTLTLSSDNRLERPALEEQEVLIKPSIILKWYKKFVNKQ